MPASSLCPAAAGQQQRKRNQAAAGEPGAEAPDFGVSCCTRVARERQPQADTLPSRSWMHATQTRNHARTQHTLNIHGHTHARAQVALRDRVRGAGCAGPDWRRRLLHRAQGLLAWHPGGHQAVRVVMGCDGEGDETWSHQQPLRASRASCREVGLLHISSGAAGGEEHAAEGA